MTEEERKKRSEYFSPEDEITFNLVDKSTVDRLRRQGDIKLPPKKVSIPKDKAWNTKLLSSKLLQGIENGDSIPKISKSLMEVIGRNEVSAVRNARTMATGAENAGRLDSYQDLAEQGVVQKKVWIATPDDRTRESHLAIDSEEVDIDELFSNGCRYPGDADCDDTSEVWNCRCTMRTHIIGFRRADGSVSQVSQERDKTMHEAQIEAEKERRVEEEEKTEPVKLNLGDASEVMNETQKMYAEMFSKRLPSEELDKFNKIFDKAEFATSNRGTGYNPATNKICFDEGEGMGQSLLFHESTHYFDYNQDYTIKYNYERLKWTENEEGDMVSTKVLEEETIKEHAGFSEYIAWKWSEYDTTSDTSLSSLDLKNFVGKVGTSDTYGPDRYWKDAKKDMDAIKNYLADKGVSREDEDFIHLSDFISAISYDSNMGSLGFGGHSYDYWTQGGDINRVAEITASYNILRALGREDLIEVERDLAPNLMQMIEKEWKKVW